MIGVSAELFESVGWVEEILDPAMVADVPRLPRVYTAAGYSCFTGRAEQAVLHAQTAQRLERDPKYDGFELGLSCFIEALAEVYCGHLDRYVELAWLVAGLPGGAPVYGKPGLVDGLQAAGLVDEALALTDDAVATARERGTDGGSRMRSGRGGTAYACVDPVRALAAWREALAYVQQHRVHFFEGFIARDAALLIRVDADRDEALALFETAIDSFRRTGNVAQLTITVASVISLFERVGRPEAAATLYGAMSHHGADHHVPELPEIKARVSVGLGSARFDECASAGASMDLNSAASYARDQIEIACTDLAVPAATLSGPGGALSGREAEVLRLVAQGLTTREIADRLFISPKTADHHIQHVYTKIGVSSRAAAALWAFQHNAVG